MGFVKVVLAFVVAVLVSTVIGALSHTTFVLAELSELGVQMSMADRMSTYFHDLIAFLPQYDAEVQLPSFGLIFAVGFLVAFVVAAIIIRFLPSLRTFGYTLAGAVAVGAILYLMEQQFSTMPVAGARTTLGFIMQLVAGAVGGFSFAALSRSD